MKLKCIGGYADGKFYDLPDHYKFGDMCRVEEQPKFETSSFEEDLKAYRENRAPDYLVVKHHMYIIDKPEHSDNLVLRYIGK